MSIIQVLPTEVVNLIAAGEIIDSLGAVVRELAGKRDRCPSLQNSY
jgi:DNA mismatch repair protein MutL